MSLDERGFAVSSAKGPSSDHGGTAAEPDDAAGPAEAQNPPHQLIYAVGRLDRALRSELRRALTDADLTITEFTTLNVLRRRRGLSNAQMARRSLVSAQAMNQVLASLENKGLVARSTAASTESDHHRARGVRLTEAGELYAEVCKDIAARVESRAFESLDADARRELTATLRNASEALQPRPTE